MAFEVKVIQLSEVIPHPDADRLDLAYIAGQDYQCVVAKGQHKAGDTLVYVPTGSIVPDPLMQELDLWDQQKNVGKLARRRIQPSDGCSLTQTIPKGFPLPCGDRPESSKYAWGRLGFPPPMRR